MECGHGGGVRWFDQPPGRSPASAEKRGLPRQLIDDLTPAPTPLAISSEDSLRADPQHMTDIPAAARPGRLTLVQWLICTIAAIGFAFDIYELLMLPLILRPALMELGQIAPGHAGVRRLVRADVLRARVGGRRCSGCWAAT